jgi:hydrogenase maturation protein HypF
MRQTDKILYRKIRLPFKIKKPILALGSQTKNTICFGESNCAYLSRIHHDLNNPKDYLDFKKDTKDFLKKHPKIIAYDLHPEYQSTKYAQVLPALRHQSFALQHHHAHVASCMAENGLRKQRVIGVAFDGTGLGSDNKIWGAEFLICDYKNFKRIAHLKEIPLIGAERAILEPWRLAVFWLYQIYKDGFLNLDIDFVKGLDKGKWSILKNIYLSNFNSPLASSMGRFFDAVASLVLKKYKANFEAELALELEKTAKHYVPGATCYNFKIRKMQDKYILEPLAIFQEIVSELKAKKPKAKIAYRFHLTIAEMIRKTCLILGKETNIAKVILSGGVFQNKLLLRLSLDLLSKEGFKIFIHKDSWCNDSGISLGQVAIANCRS